MDVDEKRKQVLPEKWSTFLREQGESGMGYQIVDITLTDGTVVKDVAIIESYLIGQIRGYKGPMPLFNMDTIQEIILTHKRWDFSKE